MNADLPLMEASENCKIIAYNIWQQRFRDTITGLSLRIYATRSEH